MKKRPRQRRVGLSPVEKAQLRAMIAQEVRETFTAAQIHAMNGEDSEVLVNKSARMFYIVIAAAATDGLDPSHEDVRIVLDACDAMYDQKGDPEITPERRAYLTAGLSACERLFCELEFNSVVDAGFKLHIAIEHGPGVNWFDFVALMGEPA